MRKTSEGFSAQVEPTSENTNHLEPSNIAAIKLAAEVGKEIQQRFPEIAGDYARGATFKEIEEKYGIQNAFGIQSSRIALSSIQRAIAGTKDFPGLIQDKTVLKDLERAHKAKTAQKVGFETQKRQTGIFSMTEEQKKEARERSGTTTYQQGTGIHALTRSENKAFGRKAVESRGFVPFSDQGERELSYLAGKPENRLANNKIVDTAKIATILNNQFHEGKKIRNAKSLSTFLSHKKISAKKSILPEIHEGSD